MSPLAGGHRQFIRGGGCGWISSPYSGRRQTRPPGIAIPFPIGRIDPNQDYAAASAAFEEALPEVTTEPRAVIDELVARAEPGLHLMTGPRFFGWVIGGSHPVGVAADMLTSAWGQNAGNHAATPAASAAEAIAARWLVELLDLPRESSVGFVTGATVANFTCLAAARGEVLRREGWDVDAQGLFGAPPITVLIGDDAHTTVFSALQFLGLGHDRVVRVATDEQGRIRPDAFDAALAAIDGPAIAILQAGQINTGAFDSFAELIPAAKAKGAWVHVDGAFGLWARACPAKRPLAVGVELADSWATDGHKWLQTPYDCGYAIVRDELAHRRAMTISASYLPSAEAGEPLRAGTVASRPRLCDLGDDQASRSQPDCRACGAKLQCRSRDCPHARSAQRHRCVERGATQSGHRAVRGGACSGGG